MWKVSIYRVDSHTPVVYENVKHAWWESGRYVVSQYTEPGVSDKHHYWTWPEQAISHIKEIREETSDERR